MKRVRQVDCGGAGLTRRRRGRGFEYLDENGERVDDEETQERIRDLAIPPAWEDVWICPHPMGHIQATGVDAAERKQYLYHPKWREKRDRQKFQDMSEFARALPAMREKVAGFLKVDGMGRERVLSCAVRLLDLGFFRIGSEGYATDNGTYGLATIRKDHVTVEKGAIVFDYRSKGGTRRIHSVADASVLDVVKALKRRRGGGAELLAYKEGGRWRDIRSEEINEHIKELTGAEFTAKDFRTWNATLLAAVTIAAIGRDASSKTSRKRAITTTVKTVAGYLDNTPAIARSSYIDPRIFDCYAAGETIAPTLEKLSRDSGAAHRPDPEELGALAVKETLEAAVIDLLDG